MPTEQSETEIKSLGLWVGNSHDLDLVNYNQHYRLAGLAGLGGMCRPGAKKIPCKKWLVIVMHPREHQSLLGTTPQCTWLPLTTELRCSFWSTGYWVSKTVNKRHRAHDYVDI